MEIEITNLEIIFQKIPYNHINNTTIPFNERIGYNTIAKDVYMQNARCMFSSRSEDELLNNYQLLQQKMLDTRTGESSVFHAVMELTDKLLVYDGAEIRCKIDELLRWREISFQLGQDLLTCAFLAAEDLRYGMTSEFFAWRSIIRSDDNRLHNILNRGMAENHFHLAGSTKIFELNWICLMNLIAGRIHDFKKIHRGMQNYSLDRLDMSIENEELSICCIKEEY